MSEPRKAPAGFAVHPGEVLREEFLQPMKLSRYALAQALHVPVQGINDIALEKRGVSPETAIRLAKFFGTTAEFWMNLQAAYDLSMATKKLGKSVDKIKRHSVA